MTDEELEQHLIRTGRLADGLYGPMQLTFRENLERLKGEFEMHNIVIKDCTVQLLVERGVLYVNQGGNCVLRISGLNNLPEINLQEPGVHMLADIELISPREPQLAFDARLHQREGLLYIAEVK